MGVDAYGMEEDGDARVMRLDDKWLQFLFPHKKWAFSSDRLDCFWIWTTEERGKPLEFLLSQWRSTTWGGNAAATLARSLARLAGIFPFRGSLRLGNFQTIADNFHNSLFPSNIFWKPNESKDAHNRVRLDISLAGWPVTRNRRQADNRSSHKNWLHNCWLGCLRFCLFYPLPNPAWAGEKLAGQPGKNV